MQEVDRKKLLYKTHEGLCNELGIAFNLDFTKYDIDDSKTVNDEGYCIKSKDINIECRRNLYAEISGNDKRRVTCGTGSS